MKLNYKSHDQFTEGHCSLFTPVPVISTSHITAEDGALLSKGNAGCHYCGHPAACGVLAVLSDGAGHLVSTDPELWEGCGTNKALDDLLSQFRALGYPWIILDGEGDIIDGLPTFDW